MNKLINPTITVTITEPREVTFTQEYISFLIDKDLTEEPNSAELTIYNLNESNRLLIQDATDRESPIDISLTRAGSPSEAPVLAFRGEIDSSRSQNTRPGFETIISCTSQKRNHRSFFFQQNFQKTTPINQVIQAMIDAVGLPAGNEYDLPTNGLLLSESFSGAVYPILQRYVFDLAMFCYIADGKLYITSVFKPPASTVHQLNTDHMIDAPMPRVRRDSVFVEMKALAEASIKTSFPVKNKRKKRKKKTVKALSKTHRVDYTTTDESIKGMEFHMFCQPGIQPDNLVAAENLFPYRVIDLSHYGDNFGGDWDTEIRCDEYSEDGGDFTAGLDFI